MNEDETEETAPVTFHIFDAKRLNSKTLYATCSAEVTIGGIPIVIAGIQARSAPNHTTVIQLPQLKDGSTYRPTLILPPELEEAVCDACNEFFVAEGIARSRF